MTPEPIPSTLPTATYDRFADGYEDAAAQAFYRACARALVAAPAPVATGRALELGCGTGLSTELLVDAYPRLAWAGLDASAEMLAHARRKPALAGLALAHGVAEAMPYPDGAFALVASSIAAHWFGPAAWAELARVTAPGGWATMVVPLRRPGGGADGNKLLLRALLALRRQVGPLATQGATLEELRTSLAGWTIETLEPFTIAEAFPGAAALAGALEARGSLEAIFGHAAAPAAAWLRQADAGPLTFEWRLALVRARREP